MVIMLATSCLLVRGLNKNTICAAGEVRNGNQMIKKNKVRERRKINLYNSKHMTSQNLT